MNEVHRPNAGAKGAHKLFWAPDSRHLAIVEADRTIVVWDTVTDTRRVIRPPTLTLSVVWAPDRSRVAVTGADGTIRVYDTATAELMSAHPPHHPPRAVSASSAAPEPTEPQAAIEAVEPRAVAAEHLVRRMEVPPDRVRDVIGPRGSVVRSIESETGTAVRVESDGHVTVEGEDAAAVDAAARLVRDVVDPPPIAVGDRFRGRVASITSYGAFVNLVPGRDGLLHVNKLGGGQRVTDVHAVLQMGDQVDVVVENVLDNGKISLALAP